MVPRTASIPNIDFKTAMIPSRGIGIYVGDDIGHRNGTNSITPTHWTMAKDYGIK